MDESSTRRSRSFREGRGASMRAAMEPLERRVYLAGVVPVLGPATTDFTAQNPPSIAVSDVLLPNGNPEFRRTGVPTDLAIDGNGFFIVSHANGPKVDYTRDGAFSINSKNQLVNAVGQVVEGYTVNGKFKLQTDTLAPLTIPPLGFTAIAQATGTVSLTGTLNTSGTVATTGTVFNSMPLFVIGGGPVGTATTLQSLTGTSGGTLSLFGTVATTVTLAPTLGGNIQLPTQTLVVNSGTTVADFENFIINGVGIDTSPTAPGVAQAGASIQNDHSGSGQDLVITGNVGKVNTITLSNSDLAFANGSLGPISFYQTAQANGESVSTQLEVYDLLGNEVTLNINTVLVAESDTGTTWNYYVTSPNIEGGLTPLLSPAGTLSFNTSGQLSGNSLANVGVKLSRVDTGAATPQTISLDFSGVETSADTYSSVAEESQDGFPTGDFNGFAIGTDGVITAYYTNGDTETVGQIVLATFANKDGLIRRRYKEYSPSASSGPPMLSAPGTGSAGTIIWNSAPSIQPIKLLSDSGSRNIID